MVTVVVLLSVMVGIWLLLVSSYMDQRSGGFHVLPLLLALIVEFVLWVLAVVCGHIKVSLSYFGIVLVVHLVLYLLMKLGTYSGGDFGILCVCQYMFLIVCGSHYIAAVYIMLLVATVTNFFRNLFRLKKMREEKKSRMPFTMYIAIGAYVALFMCA